MNKRRKSEIPSPKLAAIEHWTLDVQHWTATGAVANDSRGRAWTPGAPLERADFTDEEWAWMLAHDAVREIGADEMQLSGAINLANGITHEEARLAARALLQRRHENE